MRRRGEQGGFTLIELLIVIIVLGVLVAIVLFSLGTFRQDSSLASCRADVKQVKTAETAYFIKHDNYLTISGLVAANYLQSAPSSSDYTITVNPATGVVTAHGITGCT